MSDDFPYAVARPVADEERSSEPEAVRAATNNLLALLAWHHGDDEIDREAKR